MRTIARRTLREFVELLAGQQDQPAVKPALDAWFDEVRKARWKNTAVKRSYATVDRAESTFDVTEMCCVELGSLRLRSDINHIDSSLFSRVALRRRLLLKRKTTDNMDQPYRVVVQSEERECPGLSSPHGKTAVDGPGSIREWCAHCRQVRKSTLSRY